MHARSHSLPYFISHNIHAIQITCKQTRCLSPYKEMCGVWNAACCVLYRTCLLSQTMRTCVYSIFWGIFMKLSRYLGQYVTNMTYWPIKPPNFMVFLDGVFASYNCIIRTIFSQIRYYCPKTDDYRSKMGLIFRFEQ